MRQLSFVLSALLLFGLSACGSKRNPTGGEADLEKPTILASLPSEMGDLSGKVIEIDFSKPLDRTSITNAVYIYPPVAEKRVSLSRATLRIEIQDDLLPDTIYYVTLSTRLKDLRDNNLDRAHTLVFRNGDPQNAGLSGLINYEDDTDFGMPISVSVLSADSLLVMMDQARGSSFEIPNLNPATYQVRAYIDKNLNGRYDETLEPFFEDAIELRVRGSMDLQMSYVDTTLAQIRRVTQISPNELEIELSKAIESYSHLEIFADTEESRAEVLHQYLAQDKLYVLSMKLDSLAYRVRLRNMADAKGNLSIESSLRFFAHQQQDEDPPRLLSSTPRTGATVDNLRPTIELGFSEIMTRDNLRLSLIASDTKLPADFRIKQIQGRRVSLEPTQDLTNYRSYSLIVHKESTDFSGNTMTEDQELIFLPIKR